MKKVASLTVAIAAIAFNLSAQPSTAENAKVIPPSDDVPLPQLIRQTLTDAADVRAFVRLQDGDEVVVYDTVRDTAADFLDNDPHIAFFRHGTVVSNFDSDRIAPVHPVRFRGMLVSGEQSDTATAVFAFTLGGDSAGTFFVFIGQKDRSYEVVATLSGAQAQLRFGDSLEGTFHLWAADGQAAHAWDKQCVWCRKYYEVTTYRFEQRQLRQIQKRKSKDSYDPEGFFEEPLRVGDRGNRPVSPN